MSFGIFEAALGSEVEAGMVKQAGLDKMAAAIYDVREQLGPILFASTDVEEFRHKVAMMKSDQSIFKIIEASGLFPSTGVVRRIVGKKGILEKEFVALSQRTACWPGCHDNEAHAAKFHKDKKESARQAIKDPIGPFHDPGEGATNDYLDENYGPMTDLGRALPTTMEGARRQAVYDTIDHPKWDNGTMDINDTFEGGKTDTELKPKGDFKGYLNKVDQGAKGKIERNFSGKGTSHDKNPASHCFASRQDANLYVAWCRSHDLSPVRLSSLDRYATNLSTDQYFRLAATIQAWENEHKPKVPSTKLKAKDKVAKKIPVRYRAAALRRAYGLTYLQYCRKASLAPADANNLRLFHARVGGKFPEGFRFVAGAIRLSMTTSRRRYAAPDYLQKADDALTQLLNQKAEEFQTTIAPLQQALVTVQQAAQLQQQQNPLNVLPTPGTVNVMPGQTGQAGGAPSTADQIGMPDPAAPDLSGAANVLANPIGGAPPPGGGQATAPPGAPPPAAGDPMAQKAASRRGKARGATRPQRGAGVGEKWDQWKAQRPGAGEGDYEYEQFANETGAGERALNKLKQRNQTPDFAPINGQQPGRAPKSPEGLTVGRRKGAPFAGYEDFADCESKNSDKRDTGAYCGEIKHRTEDKKTGRRKQAWSGWGPAVAPKVRHVAGWDWDDYQNGYLSHRPQHFACSCGESFPAPSGFQRCACGRQWNSYPIGSIGPNKEASADLFIVREIPVRPDVIVASNRQMITREAAVAQANRELTRESVSAPVALMDPRTGKLHSLIEPGEIGEGEDPGHSTFRKQPKDWAKRNKGGQWTPGAVGK